MAILYARFLKRGCDIAASAALLVVLVPVMAAVALAVRLALGPPMLYRDERAGRGGRPIRVMKFRSMTSATGPDGTLLPDADRLGPFGQCHRPRCDGHAVRCQCRAGARHRPR
jgi:lipopolysaccharide/colanic/teichoic acid biosynthesis glycosyltransferase